MTDKPTTIRDLMRQAMREGTMQTDREAMEKLGIADVVQSHGVKLIDREEMIKGLGEEGSVVVCAPAGTATPFTDNLNGFCIECAGPIIFRPNIPIEAPKVCMKCAFGMA